MPRPSEFSQRRLQVGALIAHSICYSWSRGGSAWRQTPGIGQGKTQCSQRRTLPLCHRRHRFAPRIRPKRMARAFRTWPGCQSHRRCCCHTFNRGRLRPSKRSPRPSPIPRAVSSCWRRRLVPPSRRPSLPPTRSRSSSILTTASGSNAWIAERDCGLQTGANRNRTHDPPHRHPHRRRDCARQTHRLGGPPATWRML